MLYRLQVEIFEYLASPQFSTGFCVTHKLATFPTSQYSQFFKRKVEVTMKFETNLSQEPVSTRKKETFVQCYILLYSIFLQKKNGNYCCRMAKFVVSPQNCYHFYSKFSFAIQDFKSTYEDSFGQDCTYPTPITQNCVIGTTI